MSERQTENEVLEVIRLIDRNKDKLFRPTDVFYGWSSLLLGIALLYVFIEPILIFNTPSLTDKGILVLSLIAVVTALISIVVPFLKKAVIEKNFRKLETCVEKERKPLLKSLIRIKAKNTEFDLEQIYNMNRDMFTKEKLLEKLYE